MLSPFIVVMPADAEQAIKGRSIETRWMHDPASDRMGCDIAVQQLILHRSMTFVKSGKGDHSSTGAGPSWESIQRPRHPCRSSSGVTPR
jgi:hypothetical protein